MTNIIDVNVGKQVRRARHQAGVAEVVCADLIGVSIAEFYDLEAGDRRFTATQLFTLAKLFSTTVSTFFQSIDDGMPPLIKHVIFVMMENDRKRSCLVDLLESNGAEVVAVASLAAADLALEKFKFSSAILQYFGEDDPKSHLRRRPCLKNLPIILLTETTQLGLVRSNCYAAPSGATEQEILLLLKGIIHAL